MKKLFSIVLALVLALACVSALAEEPVTLTYSEVNPLDGTIVGEMAKAFKEKTEELTNGSVIIDIQANGVLGSEDQILDDLLSGGNITDIGRFSAFAFTQYGCDKAMLLSIPYTFVSEDHFWNFAASDLAKEFLNEPEELGLGMKGLCYGEEGFRHFFFTKQVNGLDDIKGMKLRVSSDPVMTGMVSGLGASATTVPFTELYSSLQTGVVDGAEQPIANYLSNAFQEVAPYVIKDGHTLGAIQIVITDAALAKLNDEQQAAIQEAADYASTVCRDMVAKIEAETYNTLTEKGVTVVEVEDKAPWVAACQQVIDDNTASQADLYQQIVAMQ